MAEVEQRNVYTVYAIYNKRHSKLYIGQTDDIVVRLRLHNNGTFSKSYTARFDGEWTLVYSEISQSRGEALVRERQLKSFRGREFVRRFIPR